MLRLLLKLLNVPVIPETVPPSCASSVLVPFALNTRISSLLVDGCVSSNTRPAICPLSLGAAELRNENEPADCVTYVCTVLGGVKRRYPTTPPMLVLDEMLLSGNTRYPLPLVPAAAPANVRPGACPRSRR